MSEPLSLKMDLGKVDTSRPCPVAGQYLVTCDKIERKESKDGQGWNLVVTEKLDYSCDSVPNEKTGHAPRISAGYILTNFLPLQPYKPSEKNPEPDPLGYAKQLCRLYDAYMGTDDDTRPGDLDFGVIVTRKCVVTIKPESSDEYGLQPRVTKRAVNNS